MSITLQPKTEQRIAERMNAGHYSSPDEVVQDALSLLDERERNRRIDLEQVRRKIAVGLEQLERGEGLDGDRVFEELLAGLDENQGVGSDAP